MHLVTTTSTGSDKFGTAKHTELKIRKVIHDFVIRPFFKTSNFGFDCA